MSRTLAVTAALLIATGASAMARQPQSEHRQANRGTPVIASSDEVRVDAQGEVISRPAAMPGLDRPSARRPTRFKRPLSGDVD